MSGDTNDICGDKANEPVPDMLQQDTDQKTPEAVSQSPKKPDQLAEALKYIARVHGYHVTDSVIWNGLPKTQDTLSIGILSRAAANCGLKILPDKKIWTLFRWPPCPALWQPNTQKCWS